MLIFTKLGNNRNSIWVKHAKINKLFSEENKVPEHCVKLHRWQGPPLLNKVKQYKLHCPLRSVYHQLIQSWKQTESGQIASPKVQSALLKHTLLTIWNSAVNYGMLLMVAGTTTKCGSNHCHCQSQWHSTREPVTQLLLATRFWQVSTI